MLTKTLRVFSREHQMYVHNYGSGNGGIIFFTYVFLLIVYKIVSFKNIILSRINFVFVVCQVFQRDGTTVLRRGYCSRGSRGG